MPTRVLDEGLSLEDWLISTQEKRDELDAYARSPLPKDISERHGDMDMAVRGSDDAGRLLADAEGFLTQYRAKAMFEALKKYSDLTSKEREFVVRDEVRMVQRLVDGMSVTYRLIHDRIYINQNANRSRL